MKKSIRFMALAMAVLMVMVVLASCGTKLSGTYELDATALGTGVVTTYNFSGSKVKVTVVTKALGTEASKDEYEATYKIDGDKITITKKGEDKGETFDFKQDKDAGTITIGLVTLKKK